ncbi:hypothetical protein Tco_0248438 [Tanacetum coccineum]
MWRRSGGHVLRKFSAEDWNKYIKFEGSRGTLTEPAQNSAKPARARSYLDRNPIACSPSRLMSSATQEYPSLIDTFFVAHTVNGEFLQDEDRRIYEEMRRLEATGTYTDDEINRLARRGKQRGHIPGVGRVLPARATAGPILSGCSGDGGCGDNEESADAPGIKE